jgi:4-diphosphocytidyl-2-C-methyl-D-erythritol kinase
VIVFPNCKINLGLHVVRKREDGYHDLETVFYPLPLKDVLEVVSKEKASSKGLVAGGEADLHMSGLEVNGKPEDNLCIKAYEILKKDHPQIAPVSMYLHKAIPMGAGLGGGSADGAFTLLLLNEKFQLNLSSRQLLDYALQLGSDCPFFIINKPCYATGRGELLQAVDVDLSSYSFMLVHPGVHINTGWAFSQIAPTPPPVSLKEIIQQPIANWPMALVNDFEAPVVRHYAELKAIKEKLYDAGALYASMTGSGSCFYGLFPKGKWPAIEWPAAYKVFQC